MKTEKLLSAIGDIDDALIAEAYEDTPVRTASHALRWIAAAAVCFAVAAFAVWGFGRWGEGNPPAAVATEVAAATPMRQITEEPVATEAVLSTNTPPSTTATAIPQVDYADIEYRNETEFIDAIIETKKDGNSFDAYRLADIDEFYKPKGMLEGMVDYVILVHPDSICFSFSSEDNGEYASFAWMRNMSPEVVMSVSSYYEPSARRIEKDEVEYIFINLGGGYMIQWADEGRAYIASLPDTYSDEEILSFLQYETIKVEP